MKQQIFNPYLPEWEYVPDGEPRIFGNRLYIYGSHDQFNGKDFCLDDYVCWSAPLDDLSDWRNEGVIYRKDQDPRNKDGKMHMCAPDCIQGKDGRYYLYYQLHALQCTCVAVSDKPDGPFEYYGCVKHPDGTPWGEKKGDSFAFDPGILIDDDGRIYLYVGHSPAPGFYKTVLQLRKNRVEEAVCLELEDDMMTVKGEEHPIVPGPVLAKGTDFDGHGFFEASSIRKIRGKYIFVYSSVLSHELCYAYSDYPDHGFRYGGTLVSIADIGFNGNTEPLNYTGNTHGGMAEINGELYIFYHRQTNQIKCSRQACAEKLTMDENGRIHQAEVTSCGLNGGPLSGKGFYDARIACNLGKNGTLMPSSDEAKKKDKKHQLPFFTQEEKKQYIANTRNGAWCGFKYFRFDGSGQKINVTVRSSSECVLKVCTERNGKAAALIDILPCSEWKTYTAELTLPEGTFPLYFVTFGEGHMDFISFEIL